MTDREKVIKGLECCAAMSGDECRKCPYRNECLNTDLPYGMPHLASDALAILKEQEEEKRKELQYIADNQSTNSPTYGKDDNAAYWYDVIEAWHEGR